MLFNSPTQFVVLGLLIFVGWLFGFASHPGGKRWRKAYEDEAVGRAQDRDELDQQLRHVDARVAELEKEKADLAAQLEAARAAPPAPAVPAPAATAGVVAASAARPAYPDTATPVTPAPQVAPVAAEPVPVTAPAPEREPEPVKRGWFDWGKTDDLTRLRGVDAELQRKLKDEKIDTFREIADLSDQDEIALERRLDLPAGYIQREEWRQQARLLAQGDGAGHAAAFGERGEPVRPLPLS